MSEKKQPEVNKNNPDSKGENSVVIGNQLPKELEPVLKDLPDQKRQAILKVFKSFSIQHSFSGPIPPPSILKGYNDIVKDGADRIMSMAEKQSGHRIALEDHAIREELR